MKCYQCHEENTGKAKFCSNCGTELAKPTDPNELLNKKFCNCNIVKELGKGSFGIVYLGFHESLKRKHALKIIYPEKARDRSIVERFMRENRILAEMHSKNIVEVYNAGFDKTHNLYFSEMEYIEGQSLKELIEDSSLTFDEVRSYFFQSLQGLKDIHDQGIIHRDIKPSNILIDKKNIVKLIDFGLAKNPDEFSQLTQVGTILGTPSYMSPEQCRKEELDQRSDIYSLGATFYHIVMGRPPFAAYEQENIIAKIKSETERHTPIIKEKTDIKAWFSDVIDRMLSKELDGRFQSIDEVLELIKERCRKNSNGSALRIVKEDNEVKTAIKQKYPNEIKRIFGEINTCVESDTEISIGFEEKARLLLICSSWFTGSIYRDILSAKVLVRIYVSNLSGSLTESEKDIILLSLASDTENSRPGWFWLKEYKDEDIDKNLIGFILSVDNLEIKKGCLRLIKNFGSTLSIDQIKALSGITKIELSGEIIDLIKDGYNMEREGILEEYAKSFVGNDDLLDKIASARLEIIYNNDKEKSVRSMIETFKIVPDFILKKPYKDFEEIEEAIRGGLDSSESSIRRFAYRVLIRNGRFDEKDLMRIISDQDDLIRAEAIIGLNNLGKVFEKEKIIDILKNDYLAYKVTRGLKENGKDINLEAKEYDELVISSKMFISDGCNDYKQLAMRYFGRIFKDLRSNLDDEFKAFFEESISLVSKALGEKTARILSDESLIKFTKAKYIESALYGILEHGEKEDVKYARKYIGKTELNIADEVALSIFRKFGETSDVELLLDFSARVYGDNKKSAIMIAAEIIEKDKNMLMKIIESNKIKEILRLASNKLISCGEREELIKFGKELICNAEHYRRMTGLQILIKTCSKLDIESILDEYKKSGFVWFDVITWLDRYIFAVGKYGDYYKAQIDKILD